MREVLLGDFGLFVIPFVAHAPGARTSHEAFVAREELLDLQGIVGEGLGCRVDGREAAADHDDGKPHLQVRDRIGLRRTRELQGHQEVGSGAHAAREPIGKVEHRGLAGAQAQRDVVESHLEGRFGGEGAAEAHAAKHRELRAAFHQETRDL